jgi:hypothetical protein
MLLCVDWRFTIESVFEIPLQKEKATAFYSTKRTFKKDHRKKGKCRLQVTKRIIIATLLVDRGHLFISGTSSLVSVELLPYPDPARCPGME